MAGLWKEALRRQQGTRAGQHVFNDDLPLQDVMAAGGGWDPAALQRAYQHAEAEAIWRAMDVS